MSVDDPQAVVQWREAMMWLIKSNADISGATIDSARNSVRSGSGRIAKLDRRARPFRSAYHPFIYCALCSPARSPALYLAVALRCARPRQCCGSFGYNADHCGQSARAVAPLCSLVRAGAFD